MWIPVADDGVETMAVRVDVTSDEFLGLGRVVGWFPLFTDPDVEAVERLLDDVRTIFPKYTFSMLELQLDELWQFDEQDGFLIDKDVLPGDANRMVNEDAYKFFHELPLVYLWEVVPGQWELLALPFVE